MRRADSIRQKLLEIAWLSGLLVSGCAVLSAQQAEKPPAPLNESGHIVVAGHATPYSIRHLPISSYPELPVPLAALLNRRGCLIPQTYEAHRPENVVHASLERAGSSDWAVLCSERGTVSLLVYFSSAPTELVALAAAPETDRLQTHSGTEILGFNWGIDPATPEQIRSAQAGMERRPALLDHDALADSVVEGRTIYHFYARNAWTTLPMPE
jgi:hypothetical protein